ncbi:hypothetical protein F5882DRAFT_410718 [Hyaloscypha sp. PMI_1271]|nr:hypothetical protein F5882DRAFT_410718 [Hyaloscypha sp. PMI_1271]
MVGCQKRFQHGSLIEILLQTVFVMLVVFNATALTAHKPTHPASLKQGSGTLFVETESGWREGGLEYELPTLTAPSRLTSRRKRQHRGPKPRTRWEDRTLPFVERRKAERSERCAQVGGSWVVRYLQR